VIIFAFYLRADLLLIVRRCETPVRPLVTHPSLSDRRIWVRAGRATCV
jgi:hypothetical protein